MTADILAVTFILLAGFVVARTTNLSFVVALPASLMGIVVVLFFAYIGGLLEPAFWVLVCLVVASTAMILIRDRSLKVLYQTVLSPQALVFVLAAIGMAFQTRGRVAGLWDELRLWAAYPKILFFDPSLQLTPHSQLYEPMRNYTPGMPLATYLMNAFSPTFSESRVFLGYGLVAAALLLPLSARVSWRTWYLIPITAIVIVAVPLLLWNSGNDAGDFYASLFVDPIVGITLGFLCWLVGMGMVRQSWGALAMGVTAAAVYLFKDGMLALAIIVLLAGSVQAVRDRDAVVRVKALRLLAQATPLLIVTVAWKLEVRAHEVPNYQSFDYLSIHHRLNVASRFGDALLHEPLIRTTIKSLGGKRWTLFGLEVGVLTGAFMALLVGYRSIRSAAWSRTSVLVTLAMGAFGVIGVVALAMRFAVASGDGISFASVSVVLATAVTALYFHTRATTGGASTRDYLAALGTLVALNLIYLVGVYFLVAGLFHGEMPSFPRYISVLPTAGVVFIGLYVAAKTWPTARGLRSLLAPGVASLALTSIVMLTPLRSPVSFDGGWNEGAAVNSQAILEGIADGIGSDSRPVRVFYVNTGDVYVESGLHHRTYFDLIGTGALVANFYIDTNITSASSDASAVDLSRERFLSTIGAGEYDYVFFASTSPELVAQYSTLFPAGIDAGDVYSVDRSHPTPGFSKVRGEGNA